MRHVPRFVPACALGVCLILAAPFAALAQTTARIAGTVKDMAGRPIKGANVRAVNSTATNRDLNVTTDAKGNWGMLGLSAGVWEITAAAPGFESSTIPLRVSVLRANPNLEFVLLGAPAKGALEGIDTAALQGDLAHAEELMADAKYDEALAIYRGLLTKVPSLTAINLAVGRALRLKKDYAGAVEAYAQLLKAEPTNQKALLEMARAQHERGDRAAAAAALEKVIAIDGTTDEARDARALLAQVKQSP